MAPMPPDERNSLMMYDFHHLLSQRYSNSLRFLASGENQTSLAIILKSGKQLYVE